MPTPSSRNEPEAVSLISTCPDEQTPRAPAEQSLTAPHSYENSSEAPSETLAATQSSREEGDSSSGGLREHQVQYATDESQSPYTQPSPIMSPTTPHSDDLIDVADKQAETENDLRGPVSAYSLPSGSRDSRAPTGDLGGRRVNVHSPIVRSPLHVDGRGVARYSIPETNTRQSDGSRRAPTSQISSTSSANIDAPELGMPDGNWDDYEVDDDFLCSEDSPSFVGCDPTSLRLIPSCPSKYLRPGSRFVGTQQSERQVYDVQVEIKHVDLRESFLCGYLRIQGLTEDHPTLTTYFEGEIIGSKYGFNTKHQSWGANERIDMSHWAKFAAFRPYQKAAKKGGVYTIKDHMQKENVFMRWKEHFLVPNHRVRTIHGASFEGFYYICFNQIEGVVHGIYFHSKSEKFQQLELKHVEDKGCMSAVEFR